MLLHCLAEIWTCWFFHRHLLVTSWATRLCSGFLLSALSLCPFISMSLYLSVSLSLPSISLSLPKPNLILNMPACWPACPPTPLSLSPPPSLFTDGKFPVEALFWLDQLFYYIDNIEQIIFFMFAKQINWQFYLKHYFKQPWAKYCYINKSHHMLK